MTLDDTLATAREAGWQPRLAPLDRQATAVFFDPLFWQALGRALGW